jgi:hypothetical protein
MGTEGEGEVMLDGYTQIDPPEEWAAIERQARRWKSHGAETRFPMPDVVCLPNAAPVKDGVIRLTYVSWMGKALEVIAPQAHFFLYRGGMWVRNARA